MFSRVQNAPRARAELAFIGDWGDFQVAPHWTTVDQQLLTEHKIIVRNNMLNYCITYMR